MVRAGSVFVGRAMVISLDCIRCKCNPKPELHMRFWFVYLIIVNFNNSNDKMNCHTMSPYIYSLDTFDFRGCSYIGSVLDDIAKGLLWPGRKYLFFFKWRKLYEIHATNKSL